MAGKYHDLVNTTKKFKGELHEFYMDLTKWRSFKTRHKLSWHKIRFEEQSKNSIPSERGIYIFTVELSPSKLPSHGYIMYAGITGDESAANLNKRFKQYINHLKNQDGRPAVYYMLDNWKNDLFFNFVALPNPSIDLVKIEKSLLNALIPPINKRDMEASIIRKKAAKF
jgi:hypothetical protein